jgi:hypothetical protein
MINNWKKYQQVKTNRANLKACEDITKTVAEKIELKPKHYNVHAKTIQIKPSKRLFVNADVKEFLDKEHRSILQKDCDGKDKQLAEVNLNMDPKDEKF